MHASNIIRATLISMLCYCCDYLKISATTPHSYRVVDSHHTYTIQFKGPSVNAELVEPV